MLSEEHRLALDALLPLIMEDDGLLHETESLPEFAYETPLHLDYICGKLPDNHRKLARLLTIDRELLIKVLPFDRICRFKGSGGPNAKMMWYLKQIDPLRRMSSPSVPWSSTKDEARIQARFNKLVIRATDLSKPVYWWRGGNYDFHTGRFWPIPKNESELQAVIDLWKTNLEAYGFRVLVQVQDF